MFDDSSTPTPTTKTPEVDRRALYLRWRPQRFEEVVGQDHVTRTLRNAVKLGRPSHAYLFTGPRGTGKTSVARILYRAVNCEHTLEGDPCNACALCLAALDSRALDLVEIDAASNRGIDDIRDLRDKVAYRPGEGRYRVYIVDEAHELTGAAWDAFLKTLEEPPPHAIFVLATTEAHKVPPTIVSRCQRFDFRRIPYQPTRELLAQVAASEGIQVEPAVLERLALVARGGLRDALSLLDQLAAFASGQVDMAVARAALSLPSIEAVRGVIDGMTRHDPSAVMVLMSDAADGGADLRLFAEELVVHLRALLLLRTGADARLTDELPEDEVAWLRERAASWSVGALMRLIQTLSDALARTRDAQQFQVQTEVALLIACDVETVTAPPAPVAPRPQPVPAPAPIQPAPTARTLTPTPAQSPVEAHSPTVAPSATDRSSGLSTPAGSGSSGLSSPPAGGSSELPTSPPPLAPAAADASPAEGVVSDAPPAVAEALSPAPTPPSASGEFLRSRWPDVIEHVKNRNPILASLLGSAQPMAVESDGSLLTVAFGTEFNRKSAESRTNRQIIEAAFERVYGVAYRLRCMVRNGADGESNLLDDPVINYAARTFGGEPKRL